MGEPGVLQPTGSWRVWRKLVTEHHHQSESMSSCETMCHFHQWLGPITACCCKPTVTDHREVLREPGDEIRFLFPFSCEASTCANSPPAGSYSPPLQQRRESLPSGWFWEQKHGKESFSFPYNSSQEWLEIGRKKDKASCSWPGNEHWDWWADAPNRCETGSPQMTVLDGGSFCRK